MAGKRRQLSVPMAELRYLVMAAMGDIKALRVLGGRGLGRAIVWLVKYAIDSIYRDRMTLARLIALSLYDEQYDWATADDPLEAMAKVALLDPQVIERILIGRSTPSLEHYSALAGALRKDVDDLMELPTKLEENGDVRERINAD